MKNERVLLAEWSADINDEYIDIPWPQVHAAAGADAVRWITAHSHSQIQLVLQTDPSTTWQRLYAEFYTPQLATQFALLFTK